jgi:hypothetical protein
VAAANELLGVALGNAGLAGELFCQLACEAAAQSGPPLKLWKLLVLCVQVVGVAEPSLLRALDALLARLVQPARLVDAARAGLLLPGPRGELEDARCRNPLARLEYVRFLLREDAHVKVSVFLPDGSAVVRCARRGSAHRAAGAPAARCRWCRWPR